MKRIIFLICMTSGCPMFSQVPLRGETPHEIATKAYIAEEGWSEGSLALNDGTELKGLLKYNDKTGIVSYQNGRDSRSLIARSVAGFEFWDESLQKQRVFYTFPYEDEKDNIIKPFFFEVLFEFKSFAVLSRAEMPEINVKSKSIYNANDNRPVAERGLPGNPISTSTYFGSTAQVSQTEIVYFMNAEGKIEPYIEVVEKESDGFLVDKSRTTNKMIDKDLLEKYTGELYPKLRQYAEENNLKFKRKSDLMRILDYYAAMVGQ